MCDNEQSLIGLAGAGSAYLAPWSDYRTLLPNHTFVMCTKDELVTTQSLGLSDFVCFQRCCLNTSQALIKQGSSALQEHA